MIYVVARNQDELTLEQLHVLVGAPLEPGVAMLRRNGSILEAAWEESLGGSGGWSWSISIGTIVLSYGWTSGNRRDRDNEIARAVAEYRARPAC